MVLNGVLSIISKRGIKFSALWLFSSGRVEYLFATALYIWESRDTFSKISIGAKSILYKVSFVLLRKSKIFKRFSGGINLR